MSDAPSASLEAQEIKSARPQLSVAANIEVTAKVPKCRIESRNAETSPARWSCFEAVCGWACRGFRSSSPKVLDEQRERERERER